MLRRVLCTTALLALACGGGDPVRDVVTLDAPQSGNPTVAMRGDTAFVAWVGVVDSLPAVQLARVVNGVAETPVRVNDIPGDAAPHDQAPPQVRVAPDGTVLVVWQNNIFIQGRRFPASNLRLARSTDGGRTFAPAIHVNDDAHDVPASHTFHDMAIAADGTVYVSWIDGRARARAEAASHQSHEDGMPASEVRVARSTDGGRTFDSGVVVYDNVCPCCRTSLAIGPDGAVYVAFRDAANDLRDILVSASTDGESFAPPVKVHTDGWVFDGCPHAGPSLAVTNDGTVHVAWYTAGDGRQGVWYAQSSDGARSFGAPQRVHTADYVPVTQTKLAVDANDDLWLVWDESNPDGNSVLAARVDDGALRRRRLGTGRSPALAAGGGAAYAAWQSDQGPRLTLLTR